MCVSSGLNSCGTVWDRNFHLHLLKQCFTAAIFLQYKAFSSRCCVTALHARALLALEGRMTFDGVLGTLQITSQGACDLVHTKAAPMPLHMKRALGSTPCLLMAPMETDPSVPWALPSKS